MQAFGRYSLSNSKVTSCKCVQNGYTRQPISRYSLRCRVLLIIDDLHRLFLQNVQGNVALFLSRWAKRRNKFSSKRCRCFLRIIRININFLLLRESSCQSFTNANYFSKGNNEANRQRIQFHFNVICSIRPFHRLPRRTTGRTRVQELTRLHRNNIELP